jgi:hypothetical protein
MMSIHGGHTMHDGMIQRLRQFTMQDCLHLPRDLRLKGSVTIGSTIIPYERLIDAHSNVSPGTSHPSILDELRDGDQDHQACIYIHDRARPPLLIMTCGPKRLYWRAPIRLNFTCHLTSQDMEGVHFLRAIHDHYTKYARGIDVLISHPAMSAFLRSVSWVTIQHIARLFIGLRRQGLIDHATFNIPSKGHLPNIHPFFIAILGIDARITIDGKVVDANMFRRLPLLRRLLDFIRVYQMLRQKWFDRQGRPGV